MKRTAVITIKGIVDAIQFYARVSFNEHPAVLALGVQPPPEEFLSSIDFIDQLDLDGDGIGEVFTNQGGFDGYQYLVFKKVGGRWKQVYDMIGDAC